MRNPLHIPAVRRRLAAAVGVLLPLAAAAQEPNKLHIHFADGTTTAIELYTRPQVTFEGDRVVVASPVATMSYAAADVLRFTYSINGEMVGVQSPESKDLYRNDGEQLTFDAAVSASSVQLFAEDGKQMPVSLTTANGRASLSLSSLPAGVYVLKVNGRTSKIVKR